MEVEIMYRGASRFDAIARGHQIITDQPPANGGTDTGMTPPELLLASLGTCAGYYAAQYLKLHSLPSDELQVKVQAEKLAQPARLGKFRIEVTTPAVNERHRDGVLRAVHKCLIHNTLLNPPEIEIALNADADAPVGALA